MNNKKELRLLSTYSHKRQKNDIRKVKREIHEFLHTLFITCIKCLPLVWSEINQTCNVASNAAVAQVIFCLMFWISREMFLCLYFTLYLYSKILQKKWNNMMIYAKWYYW